MIFKEKLTQYGGKKTRQIGKLFTDISLEKAYQSDEGIPTWYEKEITDAIQRTKG